MTEQPSPEQADLDSLIERLARHLTGLKYGVVDDIIDAKAALESYRKATGGAPPSPKQADIVIPRHPHTLVCPVCGLTRHLPDGWQRMLGTDTLKCTADNVAMERE